MHPIGTHLILRPRSGRVIARNEVERRTLARTVLEHGRGFELLGFGLPDTHLHNVVAEERARAMELARRIAITLTHRLEIPGGFAEAHPEPILTSSHLQNALRYSLGQSLRHGVRSDPDFEGTNLPDLLGLRPIGAYTAGVVQRWLPRLTPSTLRGWFGLPALTPGEGSLDEIVEAALAASARAMLQGKDGDAVAIRRAVAQLSRNVATAKALAERLGVDPRSARRLRVDSADPMWLRAIGRQVAWRRRPGRSPQVEEPFATASGVT